jgi:hypothetical protein
LPGAACGLVGRPLQYAPASLQDCRRHPPNVAAMRLDGAAPQDAQAFIAALEEVDLSRFPIVGR